MRAKASMAHLLHHQGVDADASGPCASVGVTMTAFLELPAGGSVEALSRFPRARWRSASRVPLWTHCDGTIASGTAKARSRRFGRAVVKASVTLQQRELIWQESLSRDAAPERTGVQQRSPPDSRQCCLRLERSFAGED
jgi:hypothetical protein